MGIIERIKEIEFEMVRTQKIKATEYHLSQLKAKISKLRTQLLEPPKIKKQSYKSVGKSTLLTMLTGTQSEAASYEFTTLTCIPGYITMIPKFNCLIFLELYIEGAYEGKGRGMQLNLDRLLSRMWEEMGVVRVYTKPQGQQPDFSDPVVISTDRGGCTVEDFCNHIHRSLVKDVKYVLVWGIIARYYPQHCGLSHVLHDEDVVQIVKKKIQNVVCLG